MVEWIACVCTHMPGIVDVNCQNLTEILNRKPFQPARHTDKPLLERACKVGKFNVGALKKARLNPLKQS